MARLSISKIKFIVLTFVFVVLLCACTTVFATNLANTEDQYMELKVVSTDSVDGADKQVKLEWWSYNLKFKGLDLRFSYDQTKLSPSNITTNSYTDTNTELISPTSFEFAGDFGTYMDYMVLSAQDGTYRCVMSLFNNNDTGTYIENDETLGYVVNSEGGVLLGTMSFRLFNGEVNNSTFALLPSGESPRTGIKISQTMETEYTNTSAPSVFRFTVLSNNATLSDIKYDFFNNQDDIDYKTLNLANLDASSTENVSIYKLELNEYLDNISLKFTKAQKDSKIEINGTEINVLESKEIVLNLLGREDTEINAIVTAQDGNTKHTYKIIVHRPYGTIKGQVLIAPTQSTTGKNTTNIRVFKSNDVEKEVDLLNVVPNVMDNLHSTLLNVDSKVYQTEDDGNFEIYVIPGKYDVLLDKDAYLDHIFIRKEVAVNNTINLGNIELFAGDVNKDGVVQLQDMGEMLAAYGIDEMSPNFELNKALDFNEDLQIQLQDYSVILGNYGKSRIME